MFIKSALNNGWGKEKNISKLKESLREWNKSYNKKMVELDNMERALEKDKVLDDINPFRIERIEKLLVELNEDLDFIEKIERTIKHIKEND